jgi:hypothetical protein
VTRPSSSGTWVVAGLANGDGRGELVLVADQGDRLEERLQARRSRRLAAPLSDLARHGAQLLQVLDPADRLDGALGLEVGQVARAIHDQREQIGGGQVVLQRGAHPVEEPDEARDGADRAGTESLDHLGVAARRQEADALAAGVPVERLDRAVADAAAGGVDDPPRGDVVVRVDQQPGVGQDVLDLLALVEAHPSDHAVGQADADEDVLEHAGLGVRAVEDGDVVEARTLRAQLLGLLGDEGGLVVLVAGAVAHDGLAEAAIGPQFRTARHRSHRDDRVGGIEDRLRRAVVAVQDDDLGVGVVGLEVQDVLDRGAAEAVDALLGVADDHDVAVGTGEELDEVVLGPVGVLVLVDHQVAEAALVVLEHAVEQLQDRHRLDDQIVEVERVGLEQPVLVGLVDLGDLDLRPGLARAL